MANPNIAPLYNAFSVTSLAASPTQGAPLRVGPWATMCNAFGVKVSLRDQIYTFDELIHSVARWGDSHLTIAARQITNHGG